MLRSVGSLKRDIYRPDIVSVSRLLHNFTGNKLLNESYKYKSSTFDSEGFIKSVDNKNGWKVINKLDGSPWDDQIDKNTLAKFSNFIYDVEYFSLDELKDKITDTIHEQIDFSKLGKENIIKFQVGCVDHNTLIIEFEISEILYPVCNFIEVEDEEEGNAE